MLLIEGFQPPEYAPEIVHSRVFHPCYLVPRFPLPRFLPLSSGAAFSTPAFSPLLLGAEFSTPAFSIPAFSAPPYEPLELFCLWTKVHLLFSPNVEGVVVDEVFFGCWIHVCRSVPEICSIKVESCQKSHQNLDFFWP